MVFVCIVRLSFVFFCIKIGINKSWDDLFKFLNWTKKLEVLNINITKQDWEKLMLCPAYEFSVYVVITYIYLQWGAPKCQSHLVLSTMLAYLQYGCMNILTQLIFTDKSYRKKFQWHVHTEWRQWYISKDPQYKIPAPYKNNGYLGYRWWCDVKIIALKWSCFMISFMLIKMFHPMIF
jgi:hypothetical protein